ncbi:hypothetical protein [Streptomyces sp. NPDC006289]|uniref:hypothetical protein n=1 Tax=Streptomyces sp. NPDC006289 TaxID=3156744 RepID=UPI0033B93B0A
MSSADIKQGPRGNACLPQAEQSVRPFADRDLTIEDLAFHQPHVPGEPLHSPLRGRDAVIELVEAAVGFLGRGLQAGDVVADGTQLVVQVLGVAEPGLQPLVLALQNVQPAVETAHLQVDVADPPAGVPEPGVRSVAHFPASCPSATAVPTTAQPISEATMNQGDRTIGS